ncbi:MAG: cupredoxin domain-containing protein [Actinomycetota bacterium]|nr:cupredoxin domain-containing protein [Actinomycetota bacterium]
MCDRLPGQSTADVASFPSSYDAHKDVVIVTDPCPGAAARKEQMGEHSMLGSRTVRAVALSAALSVLMAGCSSSSTPAATSPPATGNATTSPSASAGATIEQGAGGALVFSPTTLTVPQGQTITISNVSPSTTHTFTVTGQTIDLTNQGGQSQQLTIDLPPGTYPFICRFHVSQGMKGTLIVS